MEISRTFEIVKHRLYAVKFESESMNEFRRLFNSWNDTEYLFEFFCENEQALFDNWNKMTIENAVIQTRMHANNFEKKILQIANSKGGSKTDLTSLFVPLHKNSLDPKYSMQKKAYANRNTWLRIYALQLPEKYFLITGGGIKLMGNMHESGLADELKKLNLAQDYIAKGTDPNFEKFEMYELKPY